MRDQPAAVVETHISTVVFIGDDAYKLKKPVRFPFIDLSTRDARETICHREVELNRRLAPDVYRGVLAVVDEHGEPIDHLVWMRRMPTDRRLSTLITAGAADVEDRIADIACRIAEFHRTAERSPAIDRAGAPEVIAALWSENFDELRPFADGDLDAAQLQRAEALAGEYLRGRRSLFLERIADGCICDGHGDLQANDIFCLDDGPRILDCIEFDDDLRHGDVADDIAFLAMDLEALDAPLLAERLIEAYEATSGETIPRSLLHHYIAYRAQVRAKVMCLRAAQLDLADPDRVGAVAQARRFVALCADHLERARVRVIVVGGLPGTGKTTVASGLAATIDATLLRSDVIRKELAGVPIQRHAHDEFRSGLYRPDVTDRVYEEMVARADHELAHGRNVVLDASFTARSHRAVVRQLASDAAADLVELRCVLDATEAAARIERRRQQGTDASDATAAVASAMALEAAPWPEAIELSTADEPAVVIERALHAARRAP